MLDFHDGEPQEDGLPENDELAGFEDDFQDSPDDVGGDYINPMEEAEYYQGSFADED